MTFTEQPHGPEQGETRLITFGGLSLAGSTLTRPKPLLLLAYLTVEGAQNRRQLAERFWPDARDPLNSLTVALAQLRKGAPGVLRAKERVDIACESDVAWFLEHLDAGRVEDALACYNGPFLEGFYLPDWSEDLEVWVYETRERFAGLLGGALLSSAEAKAARGELTGATERAETAFEMHKGGAELELARLHRLLLAGGSAHAAEVARDAESFGVALLATSAADAGAQLLSHRVDSSAITSDELPTFTTPFVGREAAVERLTHALGSEAECRLLTLTGPGGVGKTRLAVQVATKVDAADGRFFVPLAHLNATNGVVAAIAEGLGLPLRSGAAPRTQLFGALRDKRLLLILDNLEHLPGVGEIVRDLLSRAPKLKVLATTRVQLGLQEEWVYPVEGLAYPEEARGGETYDALTLFEACARRAHARFSAQTEHEQIVRLCQLVGGTPLALELAASWLHVLPLKEIVQELETGIDLLRAHHSDVSERHRSMRVVLGGSWQLLKSPDREALGRLAVFRGGFRREAAQAVADVGLGTLATLVETSLLTVSREGRFSQHPLVRQYALERLAAEAALQESRARHARHYLRLAEEAAPHLTGPEQARWLERLEAEHDNLRAALDWAAEERETETGLRFGAALWRFWVVRGHMLEGSRRSGRLLELPRTEDFPREKAAFLSGYGTLLFETSDFTAARAVLEEALRLWQLNGDEGEAATALNSLVWVITSSGELESAQALADEALALNRSLKNERGVAVALNNVGWIAVSRGTLAAAQSAFEEALSLRRALGDARGVGFALTNLAWAVRLQGDYARAAALLDEALSVLTKLGDRQLTAWALQHQGALRYDQNDLREAQKLLERSVWLWREVGNTDSLAEALVMLSDIALAQGDPKCSRRCLSEVAHIFERYGNWRAVVGEGLSLGRLAAAEGNDAGALERFRRCLVAYAEKGAPLGVAQVLEAAAQLGEVTPGLRVRMLTAAEALREQCGAPRSPVDSVWLEATLQTSRARLGNSAYAAAQTDGRNVPPEQLLDEITALYRSVREAETP